VKRRTLLASAGTITAGVAVAGCISVDRGGTMDVVVNNCLDSDGSDGNADKRAAIQIRHDGNDDTIFDETVTVPEMSCSDVVDGVEREDVFPEAGTYIVAVTVDGYDRAESQVEFSERAIDDNSDNIVITIREDEVEIA
jgi:hypothetical protein